MWAVPPPLLNRAAFPTNQPTLVPAAASAPLPGTQQLSERSRRPRRAYLQCVHTKSSLVFEACQRAFRLPTPNKEQWAGKLRWGSSVLGSRPGTAVAHVRSGIMSLPGLLAANVRFAAL